MKTCSKCGIKKLDSEYFVRDKTTGKIHTQCKTCYKEQRSLVYKEHYEKYKDLYLARAKQRRVAVRVDLQSKMIDLLKHKTCAICNESDPVVLEFDHIDPKNKSFGIANGIRNGYKWERILLEMDKCRVLCANCHKRHTAIKANWYKK